MSASKETSDPFAEFYGYTEWPGLEPSTEVIEYPEALPVAGAVVECPQCGAKMSKNGYHTHWRMSCSPHSTNR